MTPAVSTPKPWVTIFGLLALVGVAAVVMNVAGKRAYDLWKTGS